MVEFALVAPLLLLILFAVLQFGAVYNDYVTLTDASRVGAREAAVSRHDASPELAAEAAARASAVGLDADELEVFVTATAWEHGESVTVRRRTPTRSTFSALSSPPGDLTSETTERVE